MGQNPKVFKRNFIDIDSQKVNLTVTDSVATDAGQTIVEKIRNRNNYSGWGTTGSDDTADTTLVADFIDERPVDTIILIGHNFKDFTIEKWNGSSYVAFDNAISVTNSTDSTSAFEFTTPETTSRIRITIDSTQTANADKLLRQLIITEKLESGQFRAPPIISKLEFSTSKKSKQSLSGKFFIREQVGHNELELNFRLVPYDEDLILLEAMFFKSFNGFLFWPCGGNETQFKYKRIGYRLEDIHLMKPQTEWNPVFEGGIYKNGVNIRVKLIEVV